MPARQRRDAGDRADRDPAVPVVNLQAQAQARRAPKAARRRAEAVRR